jgi:hypothetical protein
VRGVGNCTSKKEMLSSGKKKFHSAFAELAQAANARFREIISAVVHHLHEFMQN